MKEKQRAAVSLAHQKERTFYIFVLPWLAGFLLFQAGPLLASFLLGFTEWRLVGPPSWTGLVNYRMLLQDPLFPKVVLNTAYYTLGSVPSGLALALALAYLLNNRVRGAAIFRTIFFLPVVVSGVAVALLWGWLFNSQYGLINQLLGLAGIQGPAWLQDAYWAMPAIILMSLWNIGGSMLVYLAALQDLPAELVEAAALDGATAWQCFRHVTLPYLSPVTLSLGVLATIGSFQVFTPTYVLTRGGPNNSTLTAALYIYFNAFQWQKIGYASLLSWLLCLLIAGVIAVQFVLAGRWVYYEQK